MGNRTGTDIDLELFRQFLTPSWVSTLIGIVIGVAVVGGTIILTLFGTVVQQSIIGLHGAYRSSSFAANVDAIDGHFTKNATLGNVVLFVSWGMVGLVLYSIVQGVINSIKRADETAQELNYVHANRRVLAENFGLHLFIRILALGLLLLALHYYVYRLIPYAISLAHTSAYHLSNITDWLHSIAAGIACILGVLILDVLLHFVYLRARLFGNNEIIS